MQQVLSPPAAPITKSKGKMLTGKQTRTLNNIYSPLKLTVREILIAEIAIEIAWQRKDIVAEDYHYNSQARRVLLEDINDFLKNHEKTNELDDLDYLIFEYLKSKKILDY